MSQLAIDEQADRFVADGYLVAEQLVEPAVVEAIRNDVTSFADGTYAVTNPEVLGDGDPLESMLAVHFPHWVSPVIADAMRHPAVTELVGRIAGAHLAHWNGATKCMQTMLFVKPPGLQGQAWHQDERFIPTRDRSLVGAWIALDDATEENGCLWVLPGSHRDGVIWPSKDHGQADEFDSTDEAYGFPEAPNPSAAIPVPVRAGDVVFFNGYLLHRSRRNRSAGPRRALVSHYMSAGSLLPWMMDEGMDIGTQDYRMVVQTTGDDLYPWKETVEPPSKVFVRPPAGTAKHHIS